MTAALLDRQAAATRAAAAARPQVSGIEWLPSAQGAYSIS